VTGATLLRPPLALALAGFLMPPLATVLPLSLAALLPVSAVAALALGGYRELWRLDAIRPLVIVLALLGALGAGSALWSIVPLHSLLEGLRFLIICGTGLVLIAVALGLEEAEARLVARWFLYGLVIALAILCVAAVVSQFWNPPRTEGAVARWLRGFTVFDRGATTLALAVWPGVLVLMARGKRREVAVLVVTTLAVLLALRSRTAMLCLVVALVLWPIARLLPRTCAALIAIGLMGLVAIFPVAPLTVDGVVRIHQSVPRFDNSAIHRLAIWHFAIDRIAERPLLGWGLDASRALPGGSDIIDDPRLAEIARAGGPWMPLHPHDAALQWRLELGLPGAALATLAVLMILWRASSPTAAPKAIRAVMLSLVAATLVVAMLSYGFWQAWWQSSLWIMGALVIATARCAPATARP
jgi:exopolysaccharide production protein ExoQ